METCTIKINNETEQTLSFQLRKGLGLQALEKQTQAIEYDCRRADCGICIVTVKSGMENLSKPTPTEADFLSAMHAETAERLACQCRVFGDIELELDNHSPN